MRGAPTVDRIPRGVGRGVTALLLAAVVFSVAGCARGRGGPTLAKAGADLVTAGEATLKKPAYSGGYRITDPGTDVPCSKGRAKRTFAGNGTIEAGGADLDGYLDSAESETSGVGINTLGFELDPSSLDDNDDLTGRRTLFTKKAGDIRLRITIHPNSSEEEFGRTPTGRSPGPYEVAGETGCLRIK